ncbi:hypothetical protein GCK72_002448 [Caenorhabditis remanei]|uniref:Uncharacterized protein n=1 Tax=Caenorhabditis remanei TaxID=31234 RepID=A0A6A5HSF0_CAERE|nr:hypothetical protein GCK72_002448 [Caenorhabditis remanei]KAF1770629.1 hypothetical protein GCK72_002448 [Caenorhabditis remanei]
MTDNSSFQNSSFSDDLFSSISSPPVTIRRPVDMTSPALLSSHSSPYPRDPNSSPFQIATPVIITPVEARSTRDLIRVNRLRRIRRNRESRSVLSSIRRRLSMVSLGENRTEIQLNTPRTLPRSRRNPSDVETANVPSDSSNCAKMREINRLESINFAVMSLETDNEEEISEALNMLEWSIQLMNSETEMINKILKNFEEEKSKRIRKWEQIELILSILHEEDNK